jgi:hypothetical protein
MNEQNNKLQITNIKSQITKLVHRSLMGKLQIPMNKITNGKSVFVWNLKFGFWSLSLKKRGTSFVIWCLSFGISSIYQ